MIKQKIAELLRSPFRAKVSIAMTVSVYVAGDMNQIRKTCRRFFMENPLCGTIHECDYCYNGGLESGAEIRLQNYPRSEEANRGREPNGFLAVGLAMKLIEDCDQYTALIVARDFESTSKTVWVTRHPDHTEANIAPQEDEAS